MPQHFLAAVIAVAGCSAGAAAAAATPIVVGPEFTIPASTLAPVQPPWGFGATSPGRVAGALCGESYLVVWGGADGAAYATRVGLSGDVLDDAPLRLAVDGRSPSVAWNGETCLVAWATAGSPTVPTEILAARFSSRGVLLDAAPILVAMGDVEQQPMGIWVGEPQACSDGREFLVTHHQVEYQAFGVVGTSLAPDGQVTGVPVEAFIPSVDMYRRSWSCAYGGGLYLLALTSAYGHYGGTFDADLESGSRYAFFQDWNIGSNLDHLSAASDGTAGGLVLFNTYFDWSWIPGASHPQGLWAARVELLPDSYATYGDATTLSTAGETLLDPQPYVYPGGLENALAFDGKQYLAIWLTPGGAASEVSGALLPAVDDGAAPAKQALFSGAPSAPALAAGGMGSSLLLYASPSETVAGASEVRARLVLTDDVPPAVSVPASVSATAPSSRGARVTFSASAQDDRSGTLSPACLPASGSLFPPGTTRVTCMALDVAGNSGFAAFDVAVTFSWSGVLPPVDPAGSSVFKVGRTVPVKFRLTGRSSVAPNLPARLYVSRVTPGAPEGVEVPATSSSPAYRGNLFRFDRELAPVRLRPQGGRGLLRAARRPGGRRRPHGPVLDPEVIPMIAAAPQAPKAT